ncbi:MAG TPA: alpha/beta hydrolase [Anaeromyxobacteraceae bacterium]|nr:alpha/beta hydrolase [Anaeromyxobacteraceae bacterium]
MAQRELRLRANGLDFFALDDGPEDGPLALLLHGFPELSRSWRHQLPALAAAGWRAVAPDLRGYGRSGKAGPYDLRTLSRDVRDLVRALGRERAVICGHDWGGAVAWGTAVYHPEVVERLVILNCPHPGVMAEALLRNPAQLRRSLYIIFFQLPWLPEWLLTRRGAAQVGRALRGGSAVREAWPREETALYRQAFLQPGAARAALGYYRAAFRSWGSARRDGRARPVAAPVLIVWGARDRFLGRETVAAAAMAPYLAPGNAPTIRFLEEAGHFVQNEAPQRVNQAMLEWLGAPERPATERSA